MAMAMTMAMATAMLLLLLLLLLRRAMCVPTYTPPRPTCGCAYARRWYHSTYGELVCSSRSQLGVMRLSSA